MTIIAIVVAFLVGVWAERVHGVTWRGILLWRRLKARGRE